jgi:hypothetical protein
VTAEAFMFRAARHWWGKHTRRIFESGHASKARTRTNLEAQGALL